MARGSRISLNTDKYTFQRAEPNNENTNRIDHWSGRGIRDVPDQFRHWRRRLSPVVQPRGGRVPWRGFRGEHILGLRKKRI
jgi:hypothetical protein